MTRVSVIVPVFNPGSDMDELIESLLGQTMPAPEREFVFVDDGSTDGSGERLDALAAEHADVTVVHTPNSGWPGRPRNIGMDVAHGEFVFFADNDDWLERDALEALYATAKTERADIVIGKVVGHGGPRRIPAIFKRDRHGLDAGNAPLRLLTPHKLFRRGLLEQHHIRFPEGRRRLEDHLFVVAAYLAADRISVLSSRPVYHWAFRGEARNASRQRAGVEDHFASLWELLALVDAHTEPGEVRDRYYLQWYRSKVLKRLGRVSGHHADPEYRRRFYELARELIDERFPTRLDDALPYDLRLRARLARRGDLDGLEQLETYRAGLRAAAQVTCARTTDGTALVRVTGDLRREGRRAIRIVRRGDGLLWEPPKELRDHLSEAERDVTSTLEAGAQVVLRSQDDESVWSVPTRVATVIPRALAGRRVAPRVTAEVRVDPAVAAAGAPLPPGRYDVRVTIKLAGFSRDTAAKVGLEPLTITVSPEGGAGVSRRVTPQSRQLARVRGALVWASRRIRRRR